MGLAGSSLNQIFFNDYRPTAVSLSTAGSWGFIPQLRLIKRKERCLKMCQPRVEQKCTGMEACTCGCWGAGSAPARRFLSSKEEKECLKTYGDELSKELTGVQERIQELEKK